MENSLLYLPIYMLFCFSSFLMLQFPSIAGGIAKWYNHLERQFVGIFKRSRTQCATLQTKRRTTTNLKTEQNKKESELPEKRTVWKSDNQGVKKETFIQTGRRGRDGQLSRGDLWQGCGWWTQGGSELQTGRSHICVQINREEQLGSETDHTTQGSSLGKQNLKTSD